MHSPSACRRIQHFAVLGCPSYCSVGLLGSARVVCSVLLRAYVQVPNFAYAIAVQAKISTTIDKLTHK